MTRVLATALMLAIPGCGSSTPSAQDAAPPREPATTAKPPSAGAGSPQYRARVRIGGIDHLVISKRLPGTGAAGDDLRVVLMFADGASPSTPPTGLQVNEPWHLMGAMLHQSGHGPLPADSVTGKVTLPDRFPPCSASLNVEVKFPPRHRAPSVVRLHAQNIDIEGC